MLIMKSMNSAGHLTVSDSAARGGSKPKARRGRPRSKTSASSNGTANGVPHLAAAGSLTRTKALLLAALRVWELKHRVE
jgi:hypothetical protein